MEVMPGYKQTDVGVIPEDWEVSHLESITDPKRAISYGIVQTGPHLPNGIRCLRVVDIDDGKINTAGMITTSKAISDSYKRTILRAEDLVMPLRGKVGDIAIVSEDLAGCNLTRGVALIAVQSDWSARYCRQYISLSSTRKRLEQSMNGSALQEIPIATLRSFKIALPPTKTEQEVIAEALSVADALIESLEHLIAKKHHLKQGAMQELLTGNKRLSGFSGEWEVKRFSDIADKTMPWSIGGGPFGSNLKASDYVTEGVRIIQLQNIGDGRFHDNYAIYTSEEKADELLSNNIFPGEIILSKMGDPVARCCFVPSVDRRYLMASDGIRLAVDPRRFDKRFVHDYINSVYFRKKAIEASSGSTRQRIGLTELKQLPFVAPPLAEQTAIATVVSDMDAEIAALEEKLTKTRSLKQGMMHNLLTGKIRLI